MWNYCLLKATKKPMDVFVNGVVFSIKPGQFVFGRSIASFETGLSERQIRTAIKHLELMKNIHVKPSNKCSIITIIKWEKYQDQGPEKATSNRPAIDQQNDQQNDQQKKAGKACKQSNTEDKQAQSDQQNDQRVFSGKTKSDHIQEVQEVQEYNIHSRVVEYLNKKTKSSFKTTTKTTKQHIDARIKEGFTPDDFKTVIDFKCQQWIGDPKMQEYLRPQTLFNSKFESYLNAARRNGTKPPPIRKTPEQIKAEINEALS
jgi:uncharacterized phage protein (TIGR02220 family)